jgi:hypothetical protein
MMKDLRKYAFLCWLLFITAAYVYTCLKWLKNPFNRSPYDYLLSLIIISSMLSVSLLAMLLRKKGYIIPLFLAFLSAIFFLIISILSKSFADLLVCLWLLILAWVIGKRVIGLICKELPISWLEKGIFSIAAGFGFYSVLMFGLGLTGLLYREFTFSAFVLISAIFVKDIRLLFKEAFREIKNIPSLIKDAPDASFVSALLSLILISILINFIGAIAPEIQYDALNYHLTVPRIYIESHRIVDLPHIFQSYFAKSIEMLYTLGLILSGQIAAKLISFSFGILLVIAIISFGKRFFSFETGVTGAALFYISPLVGWLSTTTYIDLAVAFYIFSAIYALILWWKIGHRGLLIICGLMSGLALSAKLNAALVVVPIGLSVIAISYRLAGKSLSRHLSQLALFGIPILFIVAPWYLITYFHTGNPVFPFYNALFKSPLWPYENTFMNLKDFGMGYGLKDFFLLPWNITYHTQSYMEGTPDGVIGITFLMIFPFIFLVIKKKSSVIPIVLTAIIVAFIGIWFIIGQYARYLLPILPVMTLMVGYLFLQFSAGQSRFFAAIRNMTIIAGLSATIPIFLVYSWNIPERVPFKVALGIESKEHYLGRVIRTYEADLYLNRQYDSEKIKVLLIGPEYRFYLNAVGEEPKTSLNLRGFFDIKTNEELSKYLKGKHFTHILIDTFAAPIIERGVLEIVNEEFLSNHAQLEFANTYSALYKLSVTEDLEQKRQGQQELLTNPGFEMNREGFPSGWYKYGNPVFDSSGKKSRSGKRAVRTSKDDFFMQNVEIIENKLYALSHCTKADKDNQYARLQINWLSQGQIIRSDIKIIPIVKTEWTCNSMSANAPDRATIAVIYASVHENSEVWFDDFSFVQGIR